MSTITEGYLDAPVFKLVSDVAADLGVRAFVIGGYVRDCFLGRPNTDIDIVVEGSGIDLATAVADRVKTNVSVFKNFGTAMLHYKGIEVEFVGARKESYNRDSRKPIVEDGTLEEDQLRRDFTINAMAFSLCKEDFGALVDPFGGIRDLAAGIIRTPLQPEQTYSDDPLRMLRAIRFAAQLSTPEHTFTIVPESLEAMRAMKDRLKILSSERIVEEVNKMLVTRKPSMAFRLMDSRAWKPSRERATRKTSPIPCKCSTTWRKARKGNRMSGFAGPRSCTISESPLPSATRRARAGPSMGTKSSAPGWSRRSSRA